MTALSASSPASNDQAAAATATTKVLEVCLSPGCLADGAEGLMLKLKALAAPNSGCEIAPGVCCSLCGNGPVAIDPSTGKKHRRITTDDKILGLLFGGGGGGDESDPRRSAILEGVNACLEGDEDLRRNNHRGAIRHYARGLAAGMNPAIELASGGASSLEWVVHALCGEAEAKLGTSDTEGAVLSAGTAYQLSGKTSMKSLEVLREAYETKGDDPRKELEVLEALTGLYEDEEERQAKLPRPKRKRLSPMEANKRRTLGFRLDTLRSTLQ